MQLYKINIILEWDEASQTFSVTSPDVPQMFTFGANLVEIQHNVQEAIEVLLDGLKEMGKEPPQALQQPLKETTTEIAYLVTA